MRIHILSDLHLEFAPFTMNDVRADVVVLAGDVHTGRNGIKWILKTITDRPVVYVLGNHEFYGQKIPKLIRDIKEIAEGTNVHVLENDKIEIGGVTFFGATLWTDFNLDGDPVLAEVAAQTGMTDFRRIRVSPTYRRFRPRDARLFHTQSLEWLAQQKTLASLGMRSVIVTHHAPSRRSIPPRFLSDPLNPAFASNLERFVTESGAALWVHGHIHDHSDFKIAETRVIANPRGYPSEPYTSFDPNLVVEI